MRPYSLNQRHSTETIAAIATPHGRGGIGIIRLSGPAALNIGQALSLKTLKARCAHFAQFKLKDQVIDEGLILYFPAPKSFTGEDVIELQGHGGPVVQKMLLKACLDLGARMAEPGEFSLRGFLNDRMDLSQTEAIADLIDAGTEAGVRAANRSLQGVFSKSIHLLQKDLTRIRVFIEAAIDFPEEEIDFMGESDLLGQIASVNSRIQELLKEARRGVMVQEGVRIAIIGRPNAGKSSLLNQLARREVAIVTGIAGTTRDAIEQHVDLGGIPVTFIDTAGLNDAPDEVEKIGMEHTRLKAEDADIILFVFDASENAEGSAQRARAKIPDNYADILNSGKPVIYAANKIDLLSNPKNFSKSISCISATLGQGIAELVQTIKTSLNLDEREPPFSARTRHVNALQQCSAQTEDALVNYNAHQNAELLAEDLRQGQKHLGDITGDCSADDLLGEIFANFCIGK